MTSLLASILSQKRYLITAVVVFFLFIIVYLAATQFLIFAQRIEHANDFFVLQIADHWQEILFRQRAPFLFESIGAIYVGELKLFISVPNILLASMLGALVASNLAVSYYSFHTLSLRGLRGVSSLVSTVPAILSGAACCVPTLILMMGLQLTATFATVWSLFVPVSFVLLIITLWWSLRKIQKKML